MRFLKRSLVAIPLIVLSWMFFFKQPHKPQIYDCFPFFNELELLEVRLSEMYDHVDKFVILEAAETYRGKPKPLHFAKNRQLFEKYADKIIHVVIPGHSKHTRTWNREHFQRQQLMRGLKKCHKNDIIFLSDLDEIVKASRIQEIARMLTSKEVDAVVCEQKMYMGHLNRYVTEWNGTVCTSYENFKRIPIRKMREVRHIKPRTLQKLDLPKVIQMKDAGWHFTSMGGFERYKLKLESYSHEKMDKPEIKKEKLFADNILSIPLVEIDDSYPRSIRENQAHLKQIGFIATE